MKCSHQIYANIGPFEVSSNPSRPELEGDLELPKRIILLMEVGAARILRSTKLCYMFFDVGKVLEHCVPLPRQLMQCHNLTFDTRSVLPGFLGLNLRLLNLAWIVPIDTYDGLQLLPLYHEPLSVTLQNVPYNQNIDEETESRRWSTCF